MKKICNVLLCLIILLCTCSCGVYRNPNTISDLAYDRSGKAESVYILENDQYIPFLVLTDDYNGKTLLLRKDLLTEKRSISDYSSYYGDSLIDLYLNNEYIKCLTELSEYIVSSDIEITADDALGTVGVETEQINRKIFLLSCQETGFDDGVNISPEGEMLEYFENPDNRVAYSEGEVSSWWLRTPDTSYFSCSYVIGDNNKLGFSNAYDKNGIRPAFCVRNDMEIEQSGSIVVGQNVYIFSLEN